MKFSKIKNYFAHSKHNFKKINIFLFNGIKKISFKSIYSKDKKKFNKIFKISAITIVAAYLIGMIVSGIYIYKKQSEARSVKFAAKIYPFAVAWVNGSPISVDEYFTQLNFIRTFSTKSQQALPDEKELKTQLISQLVDQKIVKQSAIKNHIKVSRKDVNDAFNKIADANGGLSEVEKVLNEMYGMNIKEFKNMIKNQVYIEKIQNELLAQIHAEHILIKDETKAKDVLAQVIKGDKSFEDLAKEFSEDTGSNTNGGDLSWFGRGQMVKEFEDAAFSTPVGTVDSNLIKSEFGFHIIKVLEKKGTVDKTFDNWLSDIKNSSHIKNLLKV
jgi:foldase protein PrsA